VTASWEEGAYGLLYSTKMGGQGLLGLEGRIGVWLGKTAKRRMGGESKGRPHRGANETGRTGVRYCKWNRAYSKKKGSSEI